MTMTIPFLSYFKKVKDQALARKEGPGTEPKPPAPIEKPSSDRFSKTVMPNATRTLPPQDPFEMAARSSATLTPTPPSAPRTVAFGGGAPAAAKPRDLPPAVALALEPRVERVISLSLADIAPQITGDYIKPIESIDGTRRILLKASEVERGMASGKPAVSLATIYQQVPEIFLRSVASTDDMQVQLPFEKVLDQFTKLQVRNDQERHQAVPQVETPFLQVTLEDNSRFGTMIEAVETGELPPVRIEPPTAEAFAAAEPEGAGFFQRPADHSATATPARIPFKLSPNGTGGLAPESVPASSGPSVPTPSTPTRIPFKITAPSDDLRTEDEPWLTADSLPASDKAPAPATPEKPIQVTLENKAEITISLPLKPIMLGLPPFHLSGDPATVPTEAQVELPFSLIEPQLASGRVALSPEAFAAGLPSQYRSLFKKDEAGDVILPLQEVLKNLPGATLRMREDQEVQEEGANFATPFSAKAEEDAKRFKVTGPAVVSQAISAPETPAAAVVEAGQEAKVAPVVTAPTAEKPVDVPLHATPEIREKGDAKAVVAEVNKLPGVKACAFTFGDGLSLAGSLPAEYETDGLCAMAPSLMQRLENHMVETKLGELRGMTLTCLKGAVTFFMHENLCLAALHSGGDLTTEVREKLSRIVQELSRKYTHHPV